MNPPKEVYNWIRAHRLQHLCIQDLRKLNLGDVIEVAIFDRNMEEYGMWDQIPGNESLNPAEFFRFNKHHIEISGNDRWMLRLQWGDFEHPIHYNVESLATHWTWLVPEKDGIIRCGTEILRDKESIPNNRKAFEINVADLHPLTRVGWRGPVMLWKHVEASNIPVFWRDPVE
jgi:hypothetical protein